MTGAPQSRTRVGVLVSGGGSNLQALIDACRSSDFPAEIALVLSNVEGAFALERARQSGIPTQVLPHKGFADRAAFDAEVQATLERHGVELVCLAGFMRLLGKAFIDRYAGRILNIHPSLLPAFPGLHGPRQALEAAVKIAGCTVHFVDSGLDTGPIIVQAAVPVLAADDEAALAARILAEEHRIYPLAVRWVCEGRVRQVGRRVEIDAAPSVDGLSLRSPGTVR